ncbi:Uncharacterised protein [Zhongshania aliphaticivorans]|uniref:Outer membrane protein beta-barrel domain-containing protein n=1 Tax=Zhongshania aliphaticivorans TaxID=1470434 RepID=A0A5S9PZJ4_9GAMM|nr:hypothetical protein [Zhongshania aliphaticivorans]CAA0092595.1 Uncharacterised protein [Zhongshania aliphaticivorans]CAA0109931.1 Uncharacterised protein [Zhongshania aliphaticivorans]
MKPTYCNFLACLAISVAATSASAESGSTTSNQYRYLEASVAYQSTDWGPFSEETNATFLASVDFLQYVHMHARYNNGETRLPKGFQQDGWLTYGIGAHYFIAPNTSLLITVDRHDMTSKNAKPDQTASEYRAGIRHDFNDHWRLTFEAGEHDLIVKDTTFIIEGIYSHNDHLGVSLRVRDYDKLDLSSYELGVRYSF